MISLFVYGSLRPNNPNNYRLAAGSVHKGTYKTRDTYYMIGLKSGAYPYVCDEPLDSLQDPTQITGDLYEVDSGTLVWLDMLESHYERVTVALEGGQEAQMYLLHDPTIKADIRKYFDRGWTKRFVTVPSGDWNKQTKLRKI